ALFKFLFYLPLLFTAIFLSLLFLFCRRYWSDAVGLIACLFVGLAPVFFQRSSAGWFDTDILNLLFPLLIVWSYLASQQAIGFTAKALRICLAGFWVGLFSFTWMFWWFIFLIVIIYELFSLLNLALLRLQRKGETSALLKEHFLSLSAFVILSCFWVFLFSGASPFKSMLVHVAGSLTLNKPILGNIWPNVFATVGELKKADVPVIANSIGGLFPFTLSLLALGGIFYRIVGDRQEQGFKREITLLLTFWFLCMLFACFKGVRFTMFLLIPLGIFLGWAFDGLFSYLKGKKRRLAKFTVAGLAAALCFQLLVNGRNSAKSTYPLMNDSWYRTLLTLKEHTPKDAIINSWWDFGDWFKVASGRRVIFDGHMQNTPRAYWMAKVLLSRDEEEALAILKMLNNASMEAFEILEREIGDSLSAAIFLEDILGKDKDDARELLPKNISPDSAKRILSILFDQPPSAYFVVDPTMNSKIVPISYLGRWDFYKVYIAQSIAKETEQSIVQRLSELGMDKKEAGRLYSEAALVASAGRIDDWVSSRLRFYSEVSSGKKQGESVFFDNRLVYDIRNQTAYLYSVLEGKYKLPRSLFIVEEGLLSEKVFEGDTLSFSVLVFKGPEGYRSVLLDRDLAESLYVRLYILNGEGLKHFKLFTQEPEAFKVFEIIWE
ncbi:STT3 domain-containing protein, partial [Candidatus Omnitrophota bacterium]